MTRIDVRKTYKLFIGGAFPRSESGYSSVVNDSKGTFVANAALASRKDARDPVIAGGSIIYGDKDNPVRIAYYKSGSVIYRSVNDVPTPLATDVEDFVPSYTDDGKQVVGVSVSFVPRFQLNQRDVSALRLGTAAYAKTLLRNKRH